MSILSVTTTQTLALGYSLYFIDASAGNITLTIPQMTGDYQFYNLIRIEGGSNTVTLITDSATLLSGESTWSLYPNSNISLMSSGGSWAIIGGYSEQR